VSIKDLMVVFGGGNEGIVDELHVFNTGEFEVPGPGSFQDGGLLLLFLIPRLSASVFVNKVEFYFRSTHSYIFSSAKFLHSNLCTTLIILPGKTFGQISKMAAPRLES
jgi:hypothetical protein